MQNMRNKWVFLTVYGLIIFILMTIQSSNLFAIADINPDFLLILTILHSLHYGEYKGLIFGFSVGLLEDIFSGSLFGLNAFVLTLISWLANVYKKYIFVSDIIAFLIYVVIATILKYILYVIFSLIFQRGEFFNAFILLKMAGEIAYNAIFGIVFFYLVPILYKQEENPY